MTPIERAIDHFKGAAALAAACGASPQFISQISSGKRPCPLALAKRIEEVTGGAVTRLELLYPEEAARGADARTVTG